MKLDAHLQLCVPNMISQKVIPIAAPTLSGNEKRYVMDCLESTWISSKGKYIEKFEESFASFCGVRNAVSCSNGTTALHLALHALGVGAGDEVIVPDLTFVATANAVRYCGAEPVLVDIEPLCWNLDPSQIASLITPRTKGIIAVHLFGHPADMDPILEIARRHGLFVLEDAAQAHGAEHKHRRVGSIGCAGTFSFFGNKIITTGEGGMIVTDDDALAERMRLLKSHGMDSSRRYWHPIVGFNYRMTNIAAAIGLAQLEQIGCFLKRRQEVVNCYKEALGRFPCVRWQQQQEWATAVAWLFTVVLDSSVAVPRDQVIRCLLDRGVEARPVVYPIHMMPPYANGRQGFPVGEEIALRGINLPTSVDLLREDVRFICDSLIDVLS